MHNKHNNISSATQTESDTTNIVSELTNVDNESVNTGVNEQTQQTQASPSVYTSINGKNRYSDGYSDSDRENKNNIADNNIVNQSNYISCNSDQISGQISRHLDANIQDSITTNIDANSEKSENEEKPNATSLSTSKTKIVELDDEVGIDYSVSQLFVAINNAIKYKFSNIYLRGEVSGFKISNSGHMFFSLKDADNIIHAVCFSRFAKNIDIDIIDGIEVIVYGEVAMHDSVCRIKVYNMRYSGVGSVMAIIEERKQRLLDAGLFDESIKKPIPKSSHIERIGLITSATGAVLHDIQNRIAARFPKEIILFPCSVQGSHAAEEIIEAIEYFSNKYNNTQNSERNIVRGINTGINTGTAPMASTIQRKNPNTSQNNLKSNNLGGIKYNNNDFDGVNNTDISHGSQYTIAQYKSDSLNAMNHSNAYVDEYVDDECVDECVDEYVDEYVYECASQSSEPYINQENQPEKPHIDVLIIARGGGSFEDMLCFNDEGLAIAAYNCPIPIISAVGHETDFCILDFVADLRASTPTAAAEIVTTPTKKELEEELSAFALMGYQNVNSYIEDDFSALTFCANIVTQGDALIARKEIELSDASIAVKDGFAKFIKDADSIVIDFYNIVRDNQVDIIDFINSSNLNLVGNSNKLESHLLMQMLKMQNAIESSTFIHNSSRDKLFSAINTDLEKCDRHLSTIKYYLDRFLNQETTKLKDYERFINSNNPESILRRGFAIIRDSNGNVVRNAKKVSLGRKYSATLHNGTATLIGT